MDTIGAVIERQKPMVEREMAKALIMFSSGRVDYERATEIAKKAIPIYSKAIRTNQVLAHKGLDWYVKELLKVV